MRLRLHSGTWVAAAIILSGSSLHSPLFRGAFFYPAIFVISRESAPQAVFDAVKILLDFVRIKGYISLMSGRETKSKPPEWERTMNQVKSINISSRDDIDNRPLTAEERLPQVKQMLESLASRIGPQEKGFFAEAPAPLCVEEVAARLAKIAKFLSNGTL